MKKKFCCDIAGNVVLHVYHWICDPKGVGSNPIWVCGFLYIFYINA